MRLSHLSMKQHVGHNDFDSPCFGLNAIHTIRATSCIYTIVVPQDLASISIVLDDLASKVLRSRKLLASTRNWWAIQAYIGVLPGSSRQRFCSGYTLQRLDKCWVQKMRTRESLHRLHLGSEMNLLLMPRITDYHLPRFDSRWLK